MARRPRRARKTATESSCGSGCLVEAVVSVDERGQMVLPRKIRDLAAIRTGEKLAVVVWRKEGALCCISLVKAEALTAMTQKLLGPMMKELGA